MPNRSPKPPFALVSFSADSPEGGGERTWRLLEEPTEIVFGRATEAREALELAEREGEWFGFAGYELGEWTEEIEPRPACDWGIPDFWFARFAKSAPIELPPAAEEGGSRKGPIESALTPEEYADRLEAIRRYLIAGDIYQANLTNRFETEAPGDPLDLFLAIDRAASAPYSVYLDTGDWKILSVSPELFLRVEGGRVQTIPIKGTVPRGSDEAADQAAKEWLLASEKNLAELLMIVDLERNDLGRVCETGSIRWGRFPEIVTLPNVHHLCCHIEGALLPETGLSDRILATFPGGSISGAPKRRALQILRELEPFRRGPYCGAIGYLSSESTLLNLAIRTGVWKDGALRFWGGGGIVVDCEAAEEQREIRSKLAPFLEALGCPEERFWRG